MEKQKTRSLLLEIEDSKQELIACVNKILQERHIPCYILEPILRDIYAQVNQGAENEIKAERENEMHQTTAGAE